MMPRPAPASRIVAVSRSREAEELRFHADDGSILYAVGYGLTPDERVRTREELLRLLGGTPGIEVRA